MYLQLTVLIAVQAMCTKGCSASVSLGCWDHLEA